MEKPFSPLQVNMTFRLTQQPGFWQGSRKTNKQSISYPSIATYQVLFKLASCFKVKSYGDFFLNSRKHNSEVIRLIWLKFKFVRDFMPVLLIRLLEHDSIKVAKKTLRYRFPHSKSMGKFGYHSNQSLRRTYFKPICNSIPYSNNATYQNLILIGRLVCDILISKCNLSGIFSKHRGT